MHKLIPPPPPPPATHTHTHTLGILSFAWSNPIHPSRSSSNVISSAGPLPSLLPCPFHNLHSLPCAARAFSSYRESVIPGHYNQWGVCALPTQGDLLRGRQSGRCLVHLASPAQRTGAECTGGSVHIYEVESNHVSTTSFNIRVLENVSSKRVI